MSTTPRHRQNINSNENVILIAVRPFQNGVHFVLFTFIQNVPMLHAFSPQSLCFGYFDVSFYIWYWGVERNAAEECVCRAGCPAEPLALCIAKISGARNRLLLPTLHHNSQLRVRSLKTSFLSLGHSSFIIFVGYIMLNDYEWLFGNVKDEIILGCDAV